jgi:hypothetical protein
MLMVESKKRLCLKVFKWKQSLKISRCYIIFLNCESPNFPWTVEWKNDLWYIHRVKCYIEEELFAALQNMDESHKEMLRERNQA